MIVTLQLAREIRRRQLRLIHLLMLLELARHRRMHRTIHQLADAIGYGLRQVTTAAKALADAGLVTFHPGQRGSIANGQRDQARAILTRAGLELLAGAI